MGLSTIGVAIIAVAVAISMFLIDRKIADNKVVATNTNNEEDLF